MMKNSHPFHIVNMSPWPIIVSMSTMFMMTGMIQLIYLKSNMLMKIGIFLTILIVYQWWRDISREATFLGDHTNFVKKNMKIGMILFISSEVLFFLSFFWAFFHSSLAPSIELGMNWPPMNINTFNPLQIPLLNTIILLSSGFTVTWCHHSMMNNNYKEAMKSLKMTIMLGLLFTLLQMWEYIEASFSFSDCCYGSTFFMATGFHGIHVIVGTLFLMVCMMRMDMFHFSFNSHTGFEMAAWYWHFVDVVWLFLYTVIYWWGN
uniref:cytochrome c oxidase subunit 3 n=1 Tax=Pentapycnon charcoti TaxID=373304 RepID=UPI00226D219D|nr:cytochrome c oxidase subunit 3 [Pentapycnon charcoti]UZA61214.1 cytochrome c oxidase subunit 3 [Pentapycnon charcoti]